MPLHKFASLVGAVAALCGGSASGEEGTGVDTRARQTLITGKPPRIAPLEPSEFSDEMRGVIRSMSQLAVDPPPPEPPRQEVTELLATMIRHPELYGHHIELAKLLLSRGALPARDRELAILRVGWLLQAPFEWGEHVAIARRSGVSAQEVERITRGSAAAGWSERDRATVRAVEELIGDAMISDETWTVLAREFDDKQLIEFVILVGQYQTVAYYQNALRLRLRPGNEGLAAR
jgi:alkylhydroperoxidase family enzyme